MSLLPGVTWALISDECCHAARAVQRSWDGINSWGQCTYNTTNIFRCQLQNKEICHVPQLWVFYFEGNITHTSDIVPVACWPASRILVNYSPDTSGVKAYLKGYRSHAQPLWAKRHRCCRIRDPTVYRNRRDCLAAVRRKWPQHFPKGRRCPWDNLCAKCVLEIRTHIGCKLYLLPHNGSFCDWFGGSGFIDCNHGRGQPRYDLFNAIQAAELKLFL